ncbi:S1 domain-containing RNA-binding protein [Furfurilactobacillus curtus]|uniref:RNA-binding protein n=1 Tax=Furfurilactobacillus curtus TaxID=1746200 RepID=A0ABQ5JQD7_9LACO
MAVEVGSKVTGKVTGITNFGAFVDLGDHQSGLVHISQVSNNYVKDIHDVLSVGDEVSVKVISVDKGKIALSMKALETQSSNTESHHDRPHTSAPKRVNNANVHSSRGRKSQPIDSSFDGMMASFLKDSEQRLATLKHNTEGKRGGRGGRRS